MSSSDVSEIQRLVARAYGIKNVGISRLEGYDSVNFKVTCHDGTYVFKQYRCSAENRALLDSENEIVRTLTQLREYDFPEAVPTLGGKLLIEDKTHLYRLLRYVKGEFLGNVKHTPLLLKSLGKLLAKIDKTLHRAYEPSVCAKVTQWDLRYFKRNYRFLKYIPSAKGRSLVDYFFLQFDEQVHPIRYELRQGIIHNDANDWNVLTREGQVSGLIDFGDMCHSWIVNEVAVAITYVMMNKENPLEIAVPVLRAYHKVWPLEEIEMDVLYYLVAARLCTSVCNSAYAKTLKPDSEYITISERPAWKLLRQWITINPVKAKNTFRKAIGLETGPRRPIREQIDKRTAQMGRTLSLSYRKPIQMYRSAFQYMYDSDGNTFLDAYNNIMLVGHCHSKVVRAGQRAMAKLNTNTRYVYEVLQQYSEALLSRFPKNLNRILFVNSGSAATDLGLRMALDHTKKNRILALEHGYHGNTRQAIDISHYKYADPKGPGQKDYVLNAPMPKAYGSGLPDDGSAGSYYADRAIQTIDGNKGDIAAFIAEPIMGCGGQVPLAKGYLEAVYPKIRAQGGICISDEVQVGFGRLGDCFWGFEMHNIEPDMVILGKPMGNGHPIGAVVTTTAIATTFDEGPEFFSSFGGNPVSCAIGKAVLEVIDEEGLQEHARQVGHYFTHNLSKLQIEHRAVADVRGSGLFIGVELTDTNGRPGTQLAAEIKNHLREHYILIGTDGPHDNILKIKPPLSFTKEDADRVCRAIDDFLKGYGKKI